MTFAIILIFGSFSGICTINPQDVSTSYVICSYRRTTSATYIKSCHFGGGIFHGGRISDKISENKR